MLHFSDQEPQETVVGQRFQGDSQGRETVHFQLNLVPVFSIHPPIHTPFKINLLILDQNPRLFEKHGFENLV